MNTPDATGLTTTEVVLIMGQVITFLGLIVTIVVAVINKKARTPSDENDSIRLGNEFLRGLLSDAKAEREELRKTIEELRDDKKTHEEAVSRLESIADTKDARIRELEAILERLTEKLQRGEVVSLQDILGDTTGSSPIIIMTTVEA